MFGHDGHFSSQLPIIYKIYLKPICYLQIVKDIRGPPQKMSKELADIPGQHN